MGADRAAAGCSPSPAEADRAARRPSPIRPSSPSRMSACSTELQARNGDLTEALEQQTATSDVLRVISQLADRCPAGARHHRESAARLCEARLRRYLGVDGSCPHRGHHGRARESASLFPCADRGTGERARGSGAAHDPHSRRPDGSRVPARDASRSPTARSRRAAAARGRCRSAPSSSSRHEAQPVHGPADRAARDLRRPGRHRHRERAPVRGAAGAQRAS